MDGVIIFILFLAFLFCLIGSIYAYSNTKEAKEKKEQERKTKETEEMLKRAEEELQEECRQNDGIDISKLPFCAEFKKEFNISFQKFKKSFKEIALSFDQYEYSYMKELSIVYNDKYFYIKGLWLRGYEKQISEQSSLDRDDFEEIFFGPDKSNRALEIYETAKAADFKEFLYSLDDLLYIAESYDCKVQPHFGIEKKPSNLSLSVTESLFGTAAAMNKLNNESRGNLTSKDDFYIKKFIFSESSGLPAVYCVYPAPIYFRDDAKKLFEQKSYEHYQEKLTKINTFISNTNTSNTISNLDEIKKLKELLDCGAITQEEFDAKKKNLLNLKW